MTPRAGTDLASAIIGTGFAYDPTLRRHQARLLSGVLPAVGNIRRLGSAAIDLCWVGAGRLDAYYESGLNPWDYAAGALIADEAGTIVHDLRGRPPSPGFTFASSSALHDVFRDLLIGLDADGAESRQEDGAQRAGAE
jgi:myo-inositol-1(or 4)-monophosphatase